MAKIVQQQRLEKKILEKLLSDYKRQSLQLSEALSQQQENPPADPWGKNVTSEVTGSYYAVVREKDLTVFKFFIDLSELEGLVHLEV
jgi:hypothetical protein